MLVVAFEVLDKLYGFGSNVHCKYILVKTFVKALQHRVILGIFVGYGKIFLDALHALDTHILSNFNSVCTPGSNHFATGAHKITLDTLSIDGSGSAVQPTQFFNILF